MQVDNITHDQLDLWHNSEPKLEKIKILYQYDLHENIFDFLFN